MKQLPETVTPQSNTPVFSAETLPAALQKWHQTEANVWAKIVLSAGTAVYEIDTEPREQVHLSAGTDGIIEPRRPHRLIPSDDAQIQVFFYRA